MKHISDPGINIVNIAPLTIDRLYTKSVRIGISENLVLYIQLYIC